MVSLTNSILITPNRMPEGLVRVDVVTATTARAADTFVITLSDYGILDPLRVDISMWNGDSSFISNWVSTWVVGARSGTNNDTFTITLPSNPATWGTVTNKYFITIYGTSRSTHSGDVPAF